MDVDVVLFVVGVVVIVVLVRMTTVVVVTVGTNRDDDVFVLGIVVVVVFLILIFVVVVVLVVAAGDRSDRSPAGGLHPSMKVAKGSMVSHRAHAILNLRVQRHQLVMAPISDYRS